MHCRHVCNLQQGGGAKGHLNPHQISLPLPQFHLRHHQQDQPASFERCRLRFPELLTSHRDCDCPRSSIQVSQHHRRRVLLKFLPHFPPFTTALQNQHRHHNPSIPALSRQPSLQPVIIRKCNRPLLHCPLRAQWSTSSSVVLYPVSR